MNTIVYFFSGTGNSYAVAKKAAQKLDAELRTIPNVTLLDKLHINAEQIVIVFPSYMAILNGIPCIVSRFINQIQNLDSLKIFAVCTCGGYESVNALPPLARLRKHIKKNGGNLKGEYSVRLPMNNQDYTHIPLPIVKDTSIIIKKSYPKIEAICENIFEEKGTENLFFKKLFLLIMQPLFYFIKKYIIYVLNKEAKENPDKKSGYTELMPLTDRSIKIDETKCIRCGTCERICPVNNIKIINNKPAFQHHCEVCFACDEWCPQDAIHHWAREYGVKYHHPEMEESCNDFL